MNATASVPAPIIAKNAYMHSMPSAKSPSSFANCRGGRLTRITVTIVMTIRLYVPMPNRADIQLDTAQMARLIAIARRDVIEPESRKLLGFISRRAGISAASMIFDGNVAPDERYRRQRHEDQQADDRGRRAGAERHAELGRCHLDGLRHRDEIDTPPMKAPA